MIRVVENILGPKPELRFSKDIPLLRFFVPLFRNSPFISSSLNTPKELLLLLSTQNIYKQTEIGKC
jgi:hypothetical protein